MRTTNPLLTASGFCDSSYLTDEAKMTLGGTIRRAILLFLGVVAATAITWNIGSEHPYRGHVKWVGLASLAIGFILSIITCSRSHWSIFTAPIFSIVEGIVLGVGCLNMESIYPGIVVQAVALTFATCLACFVAYGCGIAHIVPGVWRNVGIGIWGLTFLYLPLFVLNSMHVPAPFKVTYSWLSFAACLAGLILATTNLIVDFDFIERKVQTGAPRYMEWYAGFALIAALVWLYADIILLLAKIRDSSARPSDSES